MKMKSNWLAIPWTGLILVPFPVIKKIHIRHHIRHPIIHHVALSWYCSFVFHSPRVMLTFSSFMLSSSSMMNPHSCHLWSHESPSMSYLSIFYAHVKSKVWWHELSNGVMFRNWHATLQQVSTKCRHGADTTQHNRTWGWSVHVY